MARKAAALPLDEPPAEVDVVSSETVTTDGPVELAPAERSLTEASEAFTDPSPLDSDVYREIAGILSPQKGKRSVTTLVRFRSDNANALRFVHIDIKDVLLAEAYACWKRHGGTDDEQFLDIVYRVSHNEVPRMYRQVAFLDLDSFEG